MYYILRWARLISLLPLIVAAFFFAAAITKGISPQATASALSRVTGISFDPTVTLLIAAIDAAIAILLTIFTNRSKPVLAFAMLVLVIYSAYLAVIGIWFPTTPWGCIAAPTAAAWLDNWAAGLGRNVLFMGFLAIAFIYESRRGHRVASDAPL